MRRKPDMKYTKKEEDLLQLQNVQKTLLESVSTLLRKDGILVYSTCTIDQEENQNVVVEAFYKNILNMNLMKHSSIECLKKFVL